jgi:surfactin synthase thioesterase subunit
MTGEIAATIRHLEAHNGLDYAIDKLADYIEESHPNDPILMDVLSHMLGAKISYRVAARFAGMIEDDQ